ncbi:MAG: aromatic acid exporter family protein [Lachnoclostridium sp.]|nr:aromatic acid exporter family protein [Lachnospira sp.]MCM1248895.1 aromatic acid exporter family protein [Lachnoclostridium sp.]
MIDMEQNHQKNEHSPVHAPIPGLGLRSLKTAFAAMLTALLYAFFPGSNPTFACIGAVFGMGPDMETSRRSGGNRFFGTIIGGFIGLALYWLEHVAYPEGCYWLRLPLVFLGIILLIIMCVLCHWPGGVQPGGVVLCIILFNTPPHYIGYALYRMLDTGIGVLIALIVNYWFSRSRLEDWFHLKHLKQEEDSATSEISGTM